MPMKAILLAGIVLLSTGVAGCLFDAPIQFLVRNELDSVEPVGVIIRRDAKLVFDDTVQAAPQPANFEVPSFHSSKTKGEYSVSAAWRNRTATETVYHDGSAKWVNVYLGKDGSMTIATAVT